MWRPAICDTSKSSNASRGALFPWKGLRHEEDDVYLLWYDDSARKATQIKIEEAINAYTDRFKSRPNVVLVNEADRADIKGVLVRSEGYVRRNNFWVGWEEAAKA
jgi:hypothetical protein